MLHINYYCSFCIFILLNSAEFIFFSRHFILIGLISPNYKQLNPSRTELSAQSLPHTEDKIQKKYVLKGKLRSGCMTNTWPMWQRRFWNRGKRWRQCRKVYRTDDLQLLSSIRLNHLPVSPFRVRR